MPEYLLSEYADVRSGLCNSLAEIPPDKLSNAYRLRLETTLQQLSSRDPHPGVHSSAGIVMRRWGLEVPPANSGVSPEAVANVTEEELVTQIKEMAKLKQAINRARRNNVRTVEALKNELAASSDRFAKSVNLPAESTMSWYENSVGMTMIKLRYPDSLSKLF